MTDVFDKIKAGMEQAIADAQSAGPHVVAGFVSGWALPTARWSRAHYFRRTRTGLISLCKHRQGDAGRLFEAGSFPRCKLCERAIRFHGIAVDGAGS